MLDEKKWLQYGRNGLQVEGIIIHNTNNYDMNAQELFEYLNNECKTSQGTHYLIDKDNVIEVMPLTWKTWTTGKGNDYAFNHLVAIEIVSKLNDEEYMQGQNKAIALIKDLMETYNLTTNDIYFHNDFDEQAYCPATILTKYGNKQIFIREEII